MFAVMGLVLGAMPGANAQAVLGADVIKQSFAGNTSELLGQANNLGVFYDTDGTQRMRTKSRGLESGTWRVTPEGEFCGKWAKLRNGVEACAPVIDLGGGVYQWGDTKFRILLGNPNGL